MPIYCIKLELENEFLCNLAKSNEWYSEYILQNAKNGNAVLRVYYAHERLLDVCLAGCH